MNSIEYTENSSIIILLALLICALLFVSTTSNDEETQAIQTRIVANFEKDFPGRNSHGGPVCLQYPDGKIVAIHTSTSGHNTDGWTEYATSYDGYHWNKYNKLALSYNNYDKSNNKALWVEEGFVTSNNVIILILSELHNSERIQNGIIRSFDDGNTWTPYEHIKESVIGYPAASMAHNNVGYVLFDTFVHDNAAKGPHMLYTTNDDGVTWTKKSVLPLRDKLWYGAMTVMGNGNLLVGAYDDSNEHYLYYTTSTDNGNKWSAEKRTFLDKCVRDPELAYHKGTYYLHGRAGHKCAHKGQFVLYKSVDGVQWDSGIILNSNKALLDGYSHNCKVNVNQTNKIMVEFSVQYHSSSTNEHVFFID